MTSFKYKTRGGSNPQGKPRVYFCCHPNDFEKYFDLIANELLSKQNCSVWYVDGPLEQNAEYFDSLRQMQLFVMPVTSALLSTENVALDIDFKFAIENHIPVLPLMQEGGLEELFNKKCGDLQFLDKNNADTTAISYDEKLEKYLGSVLIEDELAEKVRDAFDAYVFLSYRKKDRRHAQELMRLIHQKEFCRDIAIWYDEFLTPGENFNDSIKEALEKSGLFVLTVTPNLVNETNYIMTTEYPMAKQAGKPVLPAEVVPTDKKQLNAAYEGIPTCTDAHNDIALTDALIDAVSKMAKKENDSSPEHNYFIGLAYLGGIDVEVDYSRALMLIKSAADAGLIEAQKKLVSMYLEGCGVARNFDSAILWQQKVVDQLKAQVNDCESAKKYAEEAFGLGDILKNCAKTSEALKVYSALLETSEVFFERYRSYHFVRVKAALLLCIGDIYKYNGNVNLAQKHYEEALHMYEVYKEEARFAKTILFLMAGRVGEISLSAGDYNKAKKYFELAVELCEKMSETDMVFNKHAMLSVAYNNLAIVFEHQLDLSSAINVVKDAINEAKLAIEILGAVDTYNYYFTAVIHLSNIYSRNLQDDLALQALDGLKNLCIEVYEKTGQIEVKRYLARVYKNIAQCSHIDFARTKENYDHSLNLYIELVEETQSYADKVCLIKVCCAMGHFLNAEKAKTTLAMKYYEKAFALIENIGINCFADDDLIAVEDCFSGIGSIYHLKGEYQKARDSFLNAIIAAQKRDKGDMEHQYRVAYEHMKVAETFYMELEREKSLQYYFKAAEICKKIVDFENSDKVMGLLSACYDWIGIISKLKKDFDEAERFYKMSHEINCRLVENNPSYNNRRNVALHGFKIGEVAESRGDALVAAKCYRECIQMCLGLSREFSFRQCYADLAAAYYQLSRVEDKKCNLQKAYSIMAQLVEQFPDVSLYSELKRIYKKDLDECD